MCVVCCTFVIVCSDPYLCVCACVCVLPATVQKARLASKRQTGHSYPRVHALVYDVADGLLQEIDMAHLAQFHKYARVSSCSTVIHCASYGCGTHCIPLLGSLSSLCTFIRAVDCIRFLIQWYAYPLAQSPCAGITACMACMLWMTAVAA